MNRTAVVQFQNLRYFWRAFGGIQYAILTFEIRRAIGKVATIFFYCSDMILLGFTLRNQEQETQESRISFSAWESKIKLSRKNNNTFYRSIRVTSSKTANFTKISQNMPTFQSPLTKSTRPKAKLYNIYVVAYGPKFKKF